MWSARVCDRHTKARNEVSVRARESEKDGKRALWLLLFYILYSTVSFLLVPVFFLWSFVINQSLSLPVCACACVHSLFHCVFILLSWVRVNSLVLYVCGVCFVVVLLNNFSFGWFDVRFFRIFHTIPQNLFSKAMLIYTPPFLPLDSSNLSLLFASFMMYKRWALFSIDKHYFLFDGCGNWYIVVSEKKFAITRRDEQK